MGWIFTACVVMYFTYKVFILYTNEVTTKKLRGELSEAILKRVDANINSRDYPLSDKELVVLACRYAQSYAKLRKDTIYIAKIEEYRKDLTDALQEIRASGNESLLSLFFLKYAAFFPLEEKFYAELKSISAKRFNHN